jgi:transmembrane sensor
VEPNFDYYQHFSVEDFINDPFFRGWVLRPDSDKDQYWEAYLVHYSSKSETLKQSRLLLLKLGLPHYQLSDAGVTKLWDSIQTAVLPKSQMEYFYKQAKFWYAAASILVIVGLVIGFWSLKPTLIRHQTAFGQTEEITLPDSSTVILNSNSTLEYEDNWENQSAREIYIEGEAFFSVTHRTDDQPFKVFTGKGVAVEVLGTEFNVYYRAENTQVILSSGAITLSFPMKEKEGKILMKPNELVEFKESKYIRKEVNAANYVSWTKSVLNLDETSLSEMIQKAKDNYGILVQVADEKLLTQTASGSMPITDADAFMNQIAKIFNVEITKTKSQYFIKSKL